MTITTTGIEPGRTYNLLQCAKSWCSLPMPATADDRGVLTVTIGEKFSYDGSVFDFNTATCGTPATGFPCSLILSDGPVGATSSFPLTFDTAGTTFDIWRTDPVGSPSQYGFRATGLRPATRYFIDQCQGIRCEGERPEQVFTTDAQGVLSGTTVLRSQLAIWGKSGSPQFTFCPDRDINAEPCSVRVSGPGPLPAPLPTRLPGPGGTTPGDPPHEASLVRVRTTGLEPQRSYHLAQCFGDVCGDRTPVMTAADGSLDASLVMSDPFEAYARTGGAKVPVWCDPDSIPTCQVRILAEPSGTVGTRSFATRFAFERTQISLSSNVVVNAGDALGVRADGLQPGGTYAAVQCVAVHCGPVTSPAVADENGRLVTSITPAVTVQGSDLDSGAPTAYACLNDPSRMARCTVRLVGPGPVPNPVAIYFQNVG